MAAKIKPFLALEFLFRHSIGAWSQLVVQRGEELLDQAVSVLALQEVGALVPVAIICHIGAPIQIIKVEMRGSPEILLSVSVVALGPLMLLVDVWAKTCLVGVYHKLLEAHGLLVLVEIT